MVVTSLLSTSLLCHFSGRGNISEIFFARMIHDLGLNPLEQTISELFNTYDRDLDGRLDVENFCDSFQLERQMQKKPDIFFQDVMLTDVPRKHGKGHRRQPVSDEQTCKELEKMLLPKHAKDIGKLIPARTRNLGGGGEAKRRLGDAGHDFRDLPVTSMLPPRPMTALSAGGGFDVFNNAGSLPHRAATPLQQLQVFVLYSSNVFVLFHSMLLYSIVCYFTLVLYV